MDTTGFFRTKAKKWRSVLGFIQRSLQLWPLEGSQSEWQMGWKQRHLLLQTLIGHEGAVKCLCFDPWHLVSGGADGLVMAWSMVGKYERCLMAFKHPK